MSTVTDSYTAGAQEACEKLGVDLHTLGNMINSGYATAAHYVPQIGSGLARGYQYLADAGHGAVSGAINVMRNNPSATAAAHGAAAYGMGSDAVDVMKDKLKKLFRGRAAAQSGGGKWSTGSKLLAAGAGLGAAGLAYSKFKDHQRAREQQRMQALIPHYNPQLYYPNEKVGVDISNYLGRGRMFGHMAVGAGLGALGGGALSEDTGQGALRGALYGAAGGAGFSHKTAPLMKKRFEAMKKFERGQRFNPRRLLPGGKAGLEAARSNHLKDLMKEDRQEMLAEGMMGGGLGLGLGATLGSVYDKVTGKSDKTPQRTTPFSYGSLLR